MPPTKRSTPCIFFQQGRCRYSDEECRFAHIPTSRSSGVATNKASVPGSKEPPRIYTGYARVEGFTVAALNDDNEGRKSAGVQTARRGKPMGRGGRGGGKERGRGGGRVDDRNPIYRPYEQPVFSEAESCHFDNLTEWDTKRLDKEGIRRISFGPDFAIRDPHLSAICSRPKLASSLVSLSLGDSNSGNGAGITDHGVIVLVRECPNLRVLILNAARYLTDAAFLICCEACPLMELLSITGNDKVKGSLSMASLQILKDSPNLAPKMKELVLLDQNWFDGVGELSTARPSLTIKTGETLGDGLAANMIASMTGGASIRSWRAGKVIATHTNPGFYEGLVVFGVSDDDMSDDESETGSEDSKYIMF